MHARMLVHACLICTFTPSASWRIQIEAGRPIPPPPDYDGMLERVHAEVAANFSTPSDKAAPKKPKEAAQRDEEAADVFSESSSESESEDEAE